MADCRIVDQKVKDAVANIGGDTQGTLAGIALKYQTAGNELMEALATAISTMEGETKDALDNFFKNDVKTFVTEELPKAINSMSVLLEANRQNFEDVDRQIAENIAGSK